MGFEVPVGLIRSLHLIGAVGFALIATRLAPNRRRLALAWFVAFASLTLVSLWPLRPALAEAPVEFGVSAAILFGSPFATALAAALIAALILAIRWPRVGPPVRAGLTGLAYLLGLGFAQVVFPAVPLFTG